jgi:hypothetical protein
MNARNMGYYSVEGGTAVERGEKPSMRAWKVFKTKKLKSSESSHIG